MDQQGPLLRLKRRRLRGGRRLILARARDSAGVARIELRIDGRRVRIRRAARLRYTCRLHAGRHRLVVRAVDAYGNVSRLRLRLRV